MGTPHPAPWKGEQFRSIDLVSLRASVAAALTAAVSHFVYVSVAHPAPVMKAYIAVRSECEAHIAQRKQAGREAHICVWVVGDANLSVDLFYTGEVVFITLMREG